MICAGCKKHRDLNPKGFCRLCAIAAGDPRDTRAAIRDRERIKSLSRELGDLERQLRNAQSRAEIIEAALASDPLEPVKRREISSSRREATIVVHLSDWHIGELVEADKVNGLNAFDLSVADARIARCRDAVDWLVDFYRGGFEIRDAVIILGGDLMTGYIHEELMESNTLSPTEEVLWLLPRLEEILRHLGEDLDLAKVDVLTNWGNHGRTSVEKKISTAPENSYEWLIYQLLNRRFAAHPVVNVLSTRSPVVYHQAYEFTLRTIHGDEFNSQGGIGGLTIPLNKAIARWDEGVRADCTWFGHWHQYLPSRKYVGNGSIKGYDAYALKRSFAFEPPQQSVTLVDSKHGICLSTPIWLELTATE